MVFLMTLFDAVFNIYWQLSTSNQRIPAHFFNGAIAIAGFQMLNTHCNVLHLNYKETKAQKLLFVVMCVCFFFLQSVVLWC